MPGSTIIRTYSKTHVLAKPGDRILVLLASGNLASTQAVVNTLQNDIEGGAEKPARLPVFA